MKKITTVGELKILIREKVLPAYEAAYADKDADFESLVMSYGICGYCSTVLGAWTYNMFFEVLEISSIAPTIREEATKEEAILPRIEWMRKFINE